MKSIFATKKNEFDMDYGIASQRRTIYKAVNMKEGEPIICYLNQNLTLFSFLNSPIYELLWFVSYLYIKKLYLDLMHISTSVAVGIGITNGSKV